MYFFQLHYARISDRTSFLLRSALYSSTRFETVLVQESVKYSIPLQQYILNLVIQINIKFVFKLIHIRIAVLIKMIFLHSLVVLFLPPCYYMHTLEFPSPVRSFVQLHLPPFLHHSVPIMPFANLNRRALPSLLHFHPLTFPAIEWP